MTVSSRNRNRRASNAAALDAFGIASAGNDIATIRIVREGRKVTVFTIGYERRDGEELLGALRGAGVEYLADVRERPVSRKPDFRAAALEARCDAEGVEYGAWTGLGSTESQREALRESGDLPRFRKNFRAYAKRSLSSELDQLAKIAKKQTVALLCYERAHEECHRSVIADLLADRINAEIAAIL